jgi:SHS2 domain-containing protein
MGRYRLLEDIAIADCALDIEGESLDDLFETAAGAMAELMVDPTTLSTSLERQVSLEARELDLLFYDWLSELIYLKDRDRAIFPRCRVGVTGSGPVRLTAGLAGGTIDPERTLLRADLKAVTFHQFQLRAADGGWQARVVIDI